MLLLLSNGAPLFLGRFENILVAQAAFEKSAAVSAANTTASGN
jgi:hypothetical protein